MKNARRTLVVGRAVMLPAVIATGLAGTAARADDDGKRFYVDPMASYTFSDNNRGTDDGIGAQISVGKRLTKGLDLELIGIYTNFSSKDNAGFTSRGNAELYGAGAGVNVYLAPSAESFWKGFFVHLDVLRGQGEKMPGPIGDYTTTVFDAGLGYKLLLTKEPFGPFAQGIALRVEGLYRHDAHGRGSLGTSPDEQHQYFQEPVINVGFHIPLGGRLGPAPPPPEPEVQVVPVETPPPAAEPPPPPPCQPPAPGQPISLEGCKTGDTIILRGVNFEFDKAKLTVNAKTLLDQVADALLARPDIKVEVDGHTDSKGTDAYNLKLSDRRAASVMQYLIGKGVDAGRMTSKGFGESMPISTNTTDEGRELNRRVELKIVGDGSGAAAPADAPAAPPADAPAAPAADAGAAPPADTSSAPPADAASAPPADTSAPPADAAAPTPPPADSSAPPADSSAPAADATAPAPADSSAPAPDPSAPK